LVGKGKVMIEKTVIGGKDLFFTVEEGMAYWGDHNKAVKMIDHAKKAGADAIEFQLYRAQEFIIKNSPKYEILKAVELSDASIQRLIKHAKLKKIAFIATVLSPSLIEKLASWGCSAFNINASDLNNPDIIDRVSQSGKPFFISTLLATEKEVDWAVDRIHRRSSAIPRFTILHGQHTMFSEEGGPKIEETSLGFINVLKKRYGVPVGFIDHTPLQWMPAVAVAAGADVITKHMAIARSEKGPDWHICLEPDEMQETITWSKHIKASIDQSVKSMGENEKKDIRIMRKSIVASKQIKVDQIIKSQDIQFKRPGTGISPDQVDKVVGRKAKHDILPDQIIDRKDLK